MEAADPKVSGELLFPPPYGIIGIVIRFKSSLRRSTTLRQPASRQEGEGRMGMKEKKKREEKKGRKKKGRCDERENERKGTALGGRAIVATRGGRGETERQGVASGARRPRTKSTRARLGVRERRPIAQ